MSQFPLDTTSNLVEAVNYLLSGPTSIGQSFEGMSAVGLPSNSYDLTQPTTYFTGTGINPGTVNRADDNWPSLTSITPVAISGITYASSTSTIITVSFTAPASPSYQPFVQGQQINVDGVTPSVFDGGYQILDVDYGSNELTLLALVPATWTAYTSGGDITWGYTPDLGEIRVIPTDCTALVTVTGPTDRVFVSHQSDITFAAYIEFGSTLVYPVKVNVQINRYKAIEKTTLPDQTGLQNHPTIYAGYIWQLDESLIDIPYPMTFSSITPDIYTIDINPNLFVNIIDNPGIGYYWYAMDLSFEITTSVADNTLIVPAYIQTRNLRSFTAQVIKR